MWTTDYPNSHKKILELTTESDDGKFGTKIHLSVDYDFPYELDGILLSTRPIDETYKCPDAEDGRVILVTEMKVAQRLIKGEGVEFHLVPCHLGETSYSFKKCIIYNDKDLLLKKENNSDTVYAIELSFKIEEPKEEIKETPEIIKQEKEDSSFSTNENLSKEDSFLMKLIKKRLGGVC